MKLITETSHNIKCAKKITEGNEGPDGGNYYISGIFMQAEKKNRNGRIYPIDVLEREVARYNEEFVRNNRALGELGHPDSPTINLERVSHYIVELKVKGNDIWGKAKIMNTPYGKIVKNFIDEGIKLGVSTRGMGSLKSVGETYEVQDDFYLSTVDIVADPSAPEAFVDGIQEGVDWRFENGEWISKEIEQFKKSLHGNLMEEQIKRYKLEQKALSLFKKYMSKL